MKEQQFSEVEPKSPWFDPVCAVLMAITTLATAWCSYQSSRWSGQTSDLDALSDRREREAIAMHLEAQQLETIYMRLIMVVIDAKTAGNEKLETFYVTRFPADLKTAWEKWMVLKPFDDPKAPPHPLVAELYTPPFKEQIRAAKEEAAKASDRSHFTGNYASAYLSNTVLLAAVLFFAGTATKFDHRRVRRGSLAFAMALFIFAAIRTFTLPIG
jgi:hypothetical protein